MIASLTLCQNLYSFRWLKFNLKGVSSFKPLISWTAKNDFSLGLTKLRILDLNVFIESMFLSSSLRFPHSLAQCGKKDNSKALVLPLMVFIDFSTSTKGFYWFLTWRYLLSAKDSKPSSWYILSQQVPLIAPVVISAALCWTISILLLKDLFKVCRKLHVFFIRKMVIRKWSWKTPKP